MKTESSVTVPAALFNRMALCYYGGGPRHPSPLLRSDPHPVQLDEPHTPSDPAVGRNPSQQSVTRIEAGPTRTSDVVTMIPGLTPATPYARKLAGLGDVEENIPGIDPEPSGN